MYAPDGGRYSCPTDGNGTLMPLTTSSLGTLKQLSGFYAPDGSRYITLTDGNENLT